MRLPVALAFAVGIAIAAFLVATNDATAIFRAIAGAGWGLLAVIAVRPWQILLSGLAWRALIPPPVVPGRLHFAVLRWVREAVNALLPVAQIGGELVGVRLLALDGIALSASGAATVVDLTVEIMTQLMFTVLGVGLLVFGGYDPAVARWVGGATAVALLVAAAFVLAQLKGLFVPLERMLLWLAGKPRWMALADFAGLHATVVALYHQPRRLAKAGFYHLASWLVGGVEVMVALHVVGIDVGVSQSLLIESIGQATRSASFAIPGSLGIQEGGYVLVCGLVGIGPQSALELSLLKRIREVALSLPGLLVWRLLEGRRREAAP